ncbi:TRAP transporter substrate-binding protein [Magnetospira sp. QH-2]|uniref:TRAP transporter substrate-binding protein n=1 Tax=Magnetospira sp. (strain QH-2) TaxID=1288970 RepID=UPI0003E80D02|nr:TRAP transporter substrate-binding protein [Magnetospira sp. QH-2]CCQ74544.1 TRAP-type mannitol/chloroaromatic compound transport system, periplasmic component [Magnetospira sp. QH-2]
MNKLLGAALVAASVVSISTTDALSADKVRWKVPIAFGSNLPALGDNILYVAEKVKEASNGAVQFKVFEPGKLVPPFQISDAVKDKKLPAGYTWLGYDQGKYSWTPLLAAVPFGLEPWEYTAWWYHGGGRQVAEKTFSKLNIHPILCGVIGPETAGWFRKEINSLDDLKGLKMRFAGLGGKVMQKLGVSVTVLPGGEIFQALEKGAIDATEFSLPIVDQLLGFNKVAKHNYFPGWHQPFTAEHLIVNKEIWEDLEPHQRSLIDLACTAGVTNNMAKGEAIQGAVMEKFPEHGVTAHKLPADMLAQLKKVTDEVLAEEAAKDEDFKAIYESQKSFLKTYRNWKGMAYLPRDFE